jgi:prevent-host-death family protein
MARHVIHISEIEAANRFAKLLARLRAGEEIVIEDDSRPIAVVSPAEASLRLLSESLRLAREHGSKVTLDEGFSKDVEAGIASHREPLEPPAWD